jgi:hypothetical protein
MDGPLLISPDLSAARLNVAWSKRFSTRGGIGFPIGRRSRSTSLEIGVAVQDPDYLREPHITYDERFLEFLRGLAAIGKDDKLFPKDCRTCGKTYHSFPQYLCATTPKGHGFEDESDVMNRPFTMVYRHCPCGNTLVLTLTQDTFPLLDKMWAMLKEVAEERDQPLRQVVSKFVEECVGYILLRDNPCLERTASEQQPDLG